MADNRSLVFALHGSAMHTMPLSWVREDRTEVLVDIMAGLIVSCLWNWSRDHHTHICMVWFRTAQQITMIAAGRAWQRPWLTAIAFLQIMFVQRSQWLSLLCLYYMASWWTRYHNDRWGFRSRTRCSHDAAFSIFFVFAKRFDYYNYHTCIVSSGDDHHTTMYLLELQSWWTWWLISWDFLCEVW